MRSKRRRTPTKDAQPGTIVCSTPGFLVLLANGQWATLSSGAYNYVPDAMMPLLIARCSPDDLPATTREQYDSLKAAGEFRS